MFYRSPYSCPLWKQIKILSYSVWYAIHVNFIFSVFFGLMFNLRGPQGQNPRTTWSKRIPFAERTNTQSSRPPWNSSLEESGNQDARSRGFWVFILWLEQPRDLSPWKHDNATALYVVQQQGLTSYRRRIACDFSQGLFTCWLIHTSYPNFLQAPSTVSLFKILSHYT
jgi:hypothetical protein